MEDFAYQRNAGRIVPTLNGQQVTPKEAVKYVCEQLRRHCLKDACLYMPPSKIDLLTQDNCFSTGPKGVVHNDIGKRFAHPKDMIYVPFTWENMARVMFYWLLWGPYNVIANKNVIDLMLVHKDDYGPNNPGSCFIYHLPFSLTEINKNEENSNVKEFMENIITTMAFDENFAEYLSSKQESVSNTLEKVVNRFKSEKQQKAHLNAGAKAVVYIGGGTAIGLAFGGPVGAGVGAVVGGAVWGLVGLFS